MNVAKKMLTTYQGKEIFLITLSNDNGVVVNILNFGATIKDILLPGSGGHLEGVALSYDAVEAYFDDPHYIGCVIGRYANRIADGMLTIGDKVYQLSRNETDHNNHLHGGYCGFNKKVWDVSRTFQGFGDSGVVLSLTSPHSEEGYPGNLEVEVSYILSDTNELFIRFKAVTDQPTVVSLTNHTYFDLSAGQHDISSNILSIAADAFTPTDERHIPLGNIAPLHQTAFDLRRPRKIGDFMHMIPTLNYCIRRVKNHEFRVAATLSDRNSARKLEVLTTSPGLQLYCGNYLSGRFKPFSGICLEPQYYPDSPNHPEFPSTILKPGQVYSEVTSYRFTWSDKNHL